MRSNITLEVEDGILDLGEGAASLESSPETLVGTVLFEISFLCFFFEAVGKFPPALGSSPVVLDFRFLGVVGGSLLVWKDLDKELDENHKALVNSKHQG